MDEALGPHQHELPDGRLVALGRPGVRVDRRTFQLASLIVPPALPALPDRLVNSDKVSAWGMYANDHLGCCTASGICHAWMLNAALSGQTEHYTDQDVIHLYSASAGYDPSDPSTDRGAVELDVLNYLRRNPFGDDKLAAFAQIDTHDVDLVRHGIQLFGSVYIGLALPRSAQSQVGGLWDVDTSPNGAAGSWGGHAVILTGYQFDTAGNHTFDCITWGQVQKLSLSFLGAYCDEMYALLTDEFRLRAPTEALNFDALDRMLSEVGRVQ